MFHVRIPEHIGPAHGAVQRCDRAISIGVSDERYLDHFVSSRFNAIPRPMEGDIHACKVLIERSIKGRYMRRKCELCCHTLCFARVVREGCIWLKHELVTCGKGAVGNSLWLCNSITCGVSVPVRIYCRWIAQVVEFVGWIIRMYVDSYASNRAVQLISGVLHAPKPIEASAWCKKSKLQYTYIPSPSKARPTSLRRPYPIWYPSLT